MGGVIFGKIRNPHTRKAYERAIRQFLRHSESLGRELSQVSPKDVGSYLDGLGCAVATKKLNLSALRHFFDALVTRHVVILNPAASVRAERLQIVEGKTPEITIEQARLLLRSIDTTNIVGLRDRAIIGTLIYTAARVAAVAKLRRCDFYDLGDQNCLRFHEKGASPEKSPSATISVGSFRNSWKAADSNIPTKLRDVMGEITKVSNSLISQQDVETAMTSFDPIWESMTLRDQIRLIQVVVQRVDYDGETGRVTITFNPIGIKCRAEHATKDLADAHV